MLIFLLSSVNLNFMISVGFLSTTPEQGAEQVVEQGVEQGNEKLLNYTKISSENL
jgi:hypothetical protein